MNWLSNFIRPSIRSIVGDQKDVPDNLWQKCPKCEGMLFSRELTANDNVCYHCDFHMAVSVTKRLELMFDNGKYAKVETPDVPHDPLKFKDKKKYVDRLKDTKSKTGEKEFNIVGFNNEEADKMMEKARGTFDQVERKKYLDRFQEILHDEQPYLFLYAPYSLIAVHKRIQNIEEAPAGISHNFIDWYIPQELQTRNVMQQ